jgi:cytochrome c553
MMKIKKDKVGTVASLFIGMMIVLSSCTTDPNSPGVEYMPDMYRSPSYETYGVNFLFADSMEARMPVSGTMSQGEWPYQGSLIDALPYEFENTPDGYDLAGLTLKNPIKNTGLHTEKGKELFLQFCIQCHGSKGMGDGKLIQIDKYPPPPPFNGALKNLEEGKMFHSLHYGKNLMPSHATQLTKEERWKIVLHIQELQNS